MHRADKATLRLALGLGAATLVAYGLALSVPFMACVVAVAVLCGSGPPLPFLKGAVLAGVVAAVMALGVLLVPLLEHYAVTGVLVTAALLYAVFRARARVDNPFNTSPLGPVTMISVVAVTVIPVMGVAEQALASGFIQALVAGIVIGVAVNIASHALFPDAPGQAGPPPATFLLDRETADWLALRATLIVMPTFVLALTNPSFYVATVVKTVILAQQASSLSARSAGRILMGSTLAGAGLAAAIWLGLSMRPNLWMLMLWLMAAALWTGARLFGARATSLPPSFWRDALMTMLILLGPAIEDSANGSDVYRASAIRVALFVGVTLYAWATIWALEWWRSSRRKTTVPG